MTFFGKVIKGLGSIAMMVGLLVFGMIFIIAPQLAANLGMRYVELTVD